MALQPLPKVVITAGRRRPAIRILDEITKVIEVTFEIFLFMTASLMLGTTVT